MPIGTKRLGVVIGIPADVGKRLIGRLRNSGHWHIQFLPRSRSPQGMLEVDGRAARNAIEAWADDAASYTEYGRVTVVVAPYVRMPDDVTALLEALAGLGAEIIYPSQGDGVWPKDAKDQVFKDTLFTALIGCFAAPETSATDIDLPTAGDVRFYKKTHSAPTHDIMVRVPDCGCNNWETSSAADKARKGIARLEGDRVDWKTMHHCASCTGGGMWKVRW